MSSTHSPPPTPVRLRHSNSYPIQTSEYSPSVDTGCTLSSDDHLTPLPATIRALKDAKQADKQARTLVVCLDGTGDQFDGDNSNIVHLVSCLKKHSPDHQMTYYQSGIGTYSEGGMTDGIGAGLDMAVGSGLGVHIKDAYRFLMQNYREGDKICLFGFSRGAYTVRCLAGMLHKVGLLPASNGAQVNFAYKFYKDDSTEGFKMSSEFKKTFCTNVNVHFVGVFDCVASVGFFPRKLPFSKSATNSIGHFRHAMALDEHRAKFKVSQYAQQDPEAAKRKEQKVADIENARKEIEGIKRSGTAIEQEKLEAYFEAYERTHGARTAVATDVKEVWFMGGHADVGGGAVKNEERHRLSHIPLRWMIRQCFECDTGIFFDTAALVDQGLDAHTLYPLYHPATRPTCGPPPTLMEKHRKGRVPPLKMRRTLLSIGDNKDHLVNPKLDQESNETRHLALLSEQTENQFDTLAPMNDMLKIAKGWWILEVWPIKVRILNKDKSAWVKKVRCNMGRYRAIREKRPNLHWSVQQMVDEGKYSISGRTTTDTQWQVVA